MPRPSASEPLMPENEVILEHFLNPRNVGILSPADAEAMVTNDACGDTLKLTLRIVDGVITQAKWKTEGCGTSIAASSLLSEMLEGKTLVEAAAIDRHAIATAFGGLSPAKIHASFLAVDAVKAALANYRAKHASRSGQAF